jgi:hypothetical protein
MCKAWVENRVMKIADFMLLTSLLREPAIPRAQRRHRTDTWDLCHI